MPVNTYILGYVPSMGPSKATLCDVSSTGFVDLLDAAFLGGHGQSGQDRVLPWEVHSTVTLAVLGQSRGLSSGSTQCQGLGQQA